MPLQQDIRSAPQRVAFIYFAQELHQESRHRGVHPVFDREQSLFLVPCPKQDHEQLQDRQVWQPGYAPGILIPGIVELLSGKNHENKSFDFIGCRRHDA